MEDPNSRPAAAKIIDAALKSHQYAVQRGVCGASAAMVVYWTLKEEGYLNDSPILEHCPWDCSSCHTGDGVCEDEDGNPIDGWNE